jgi:DNA polymerase elongation subunit (family B)
MNAPCFLDFVTWWATPKNNPDIVTGWNSRFFDVPYLVNRIRQLLGEGTVNLLSPWGFIESQNVKTKHGEQTAYVIAGISQLDYMDLFRKFTTHTYGNQESYKLGSIANVVLGDDKLSYEEYGTLHALYENNFQLFVDYNIKDVEIVDRLEDKLGLITLALTLAYIGGVNYNDTLGTTAIWESIIYRDLMRKGIAPNVHQIVPSYKYEVVGALEDSTSGTSREASHIAGGYVKPPKVGLHNWVCSFDLNSLYPNLIIQYNMSPETVLPEQTPDIDVDSVLNGIEVIPTIPNAITAANGVMFDPTQVGVIPRLIREIYDRRVSLKKAMLIEKKRFETIEKTNKIERYRCEREISRLENQQIAVKILLNSLYGAMGNKYFQYYDTRIAEGTTLSGQLAIRSAEKAVNGFLNETLKTKNQDYVIAIDTDSLYVSMEAIVNKFTPKNPVKFLDEFCAKGVEPIVNKSYDLLAKKMGCPTNRMGMKREAIADRGIWAAKKRYILSVHNNEGVQYAKPKIKVMGIESVKSSTPAVCRDALKHMFDVIMTKSETEAQLEIALFRDKFENLSPAEIACPRGVTKVDYYQPEGGVGIYATREHPAFAVGYQQARDYANRLRWDPITNKPVMEKITIKVISTPINARGALLYNHYLKANGFEQKYPLIRDGDKMKYIYLKKPNLIHENVIAFIDTLPKELNLDRYIDYQLQFEKTFLDPLDIIFKAIGWQLEPTKAVASLEEFFT